MVMNQETDATTASLLGKIVEELRELRRPRLVFDIGPSEQEWPSFYEVVLKNVGGSPAYDISCTFDPDLPYHDTTLSKLNIFRNLSFLEQGAEVRFFFDSSVKFLNDDHFPKTTKIKIAYKNSQGDVLDETLSVDLEKYRHILFHDVKGIQEVVKQLEGVARTLDKIERRGLLTKTPADLLNEQRQLMKHYKKGKK